MMRGLNLDWVDVGAVLGPGVYALVFAGEVVYVGKAKRLITRLHTHRQTLMATRKRGATPKGWNRAIPFSSVGIIACKEEDMDVIEARMIAKYRPRYNVNLKPESRVSLETVGFDFTAIGIVPPQQMALRERRRA